MLQMKHKFFMLVIILLASASMALADNELEASELYDKGIRLLEAGKPDKAFDAFHKSILLNPNVSMPYLHRGRLYVEKEDWKRAGEDFNQAIKNDRGNLEAIMERGKLYDANKMYNYAISDYTVLVKKGELEAKAVALKLRASVYVKTDETGKALEDYTELIEIEPNGETGYFGRANIYDSMEESLKALEDYNRAIEINPLNVEALERRSKIYDYIGERDKALQDRVTAHRILNPEEEKDSDLPPVPGAEPTGISNAPEADKPIEKAEAAVPPVPTAPAAEAVEDKKEKIEEAVEVPEESEWKQIARTTDGTKHYMDIGGIDKLTDTLRRVRVKKEMGEMKKGYMALYKAALRKRGVDPAKFNYSIIQYEVNCLEKTLRTVSFSDHSASDEVLYERGSMESSAKSVKPRSMDSIVVSYTCN